MNKNLISKLANIATSLDKQGEYQLADKIDSIIKTAGYSLTLSKKERDAIDFVGDRYSTGYDLKQALSKAAKQPTDTEWEEDGDITFAIPEHVAWEIKELAEQEGGGEGKYSFPLFAPALVSKFISFLDKIV